MPRPRLTVDRRSRFGTVELLPSGKHRARYKTNGGGAQTFNTRTEAWNWLDGIKTAMRSNSFVPTTEARQNFGFLANDWLSKMTNLSGNVETDYKLIVERIVEHFGKAKTVEVDYDDVHKWITQLPDLYGFKSGARTQKHKMVLSQIFTFAQQRKLRQDNPCDYFRVAGDERGEMVFLNHNEVHRLVDLMEAPWGLVISLAAYSGLRAGEIWDAKVKSLDLDRRLLQVVSSVSQVKGKGLVSRPAPKNGQWRAARLSTDLAAGLKAHVAGKAPDDYIFTAPEGGQVYHCHFSSRFWDGPRKAINPELRFHDLRHTCAAFHFKAGANAEEVKRILGHSSLAMVSRYAHIFPEAFGSLVDILDVDIAKARNELSVQRTTDRTMKPVLTPDQV